MYDHYVYIATLHPVSGPLCAKFPHVDPGIFSIQKKNLSAD